MAKYLLPDSKNVILDFASFGIKDWLKYTSNVHHPCISENSVCEIDRNKVCSDLMFLSTSLLGIYK